MSPKPFDPKMLLLVAEGQRIHMLKILNVLAKFEFENVASVSDGEEALKEIQTNRFRLVLLGANLKKEKSLKILSSILEDEDSAGTPVIFTYNPDEMETAKTALDRGAVGILSKPVDEKMFREVVSKVLDMNIATKEEHKEEIEQGRKAAMPIIERGKQLLAMANHDLDGAAAAFEEAIRVGGDSAEAYIGLAEIYMAKGDTESSEEAIRKAGQLDPEVFRVFHRKREQDRLIERGKRDILKRRFARAEATFEKVIELNENNVEAYVGLAEAEAGLRETLAARKAMQKALSFEPNAEMIPLYDRIGIIATRSKEYGIAMEAYDRALSFEPQNASLYYNKSLVLLLQKIFDEALILLDKAIEINPDFTEAKLTQEKVAKWAQAARVKNSA
ncbi:MAG: tetratricopeptide repeat protein [bacterium]